MPDGSLAIGWTRRSRAGWDWLDDTDAPLAEEVERYQVNVSRSAGSPLTVTTGAPLVTLSFEQIGAIGGSGPLTITVGQVGTSAASLPPATLTVLLGA